MGIPPPATGQSVPSVVKLEPCVNKTVVLTPEQWDLVVTIGDGCRVSDVLEGGSPNEHEGTTALKELFDLHLVQVDGTKPYGWAHTPPATNGGSTPRSSFAPLLAAGPPATPQMGTPKDLETSTAPLEGNVTTASDGRPHELEDEEQLRPEPGYQASQEPLAPRQAPDVRTVRLVEAGPRPLDVVSALAELGCPPQLAADYVGAAIKGGVPDVVVGVSAFEAEKVVDALRKAGAIPSVAPPSAIIPTPSVTAAAPLAPKPVAAEAHSAVAPRPTLPKPPAAPVAPRTGQRAGREKIAQVEVVERYLAAYNVGDLGRLVSCLSAAVVLSDATGRILVEGADAVAGRIAQVFERYPDLQVTVLGRSTAGQWVIDHQLTTYAGGVIEETTLCYRVEGNLVERLVLLT